MIDDDFGNWFAGFAAGEGYFAIGKSIRSENPNCYFRCKFIIGLRADDKQILEKLRDALGFGTVYEHPARLGSNTQEAATLHIHSIKDCNELIRIFEKYPIRSKKQKEFEIWKRAVKELQKPSIHRNSETLDYCFLKIRELRQYETHDEIIKPQIKELQLIIKF